MLDARGPTGRPLPQRVPRATGLEGEPVDRGQERRGRERARRAPVDAEDLRRKLAGFQRGLQAGRRDAESEIHGDAGQIGAAAPAAGPADTVEEATR